MKKNETFCWLFSFSAYKSYFFVLLLLAFGLIARSQDTSLTVISNIKGAPANMKLSELKSVFMGEKQRWSDDTKTKVTIALMRMTTSAGKNTCSKVYNMSRQDVMGFLSNLYYAGKIDEPKTFKSAEELISFLGDNPGAIGITDKVLTNPNIKITLIDGRKSF